MVRKLCLSFLFFITIVACNKTIVQENNSIVTKTSSQVGIGLGLYDESSVDDKQTIHKIKANATYQPKVYIKNNFPDEYTYRLFFFKDYKQSEVFRDNNKSNFIDINLKPSEEESFEVQVPSVEEGLHDFIVIAVRDPDNSLEKNQYIDASQVYLSRRVALVSGTNKITNKISYTPINTNENVDSQEIYTEPFITFNNQNQTVASLISKEKLKNATINMGSSVENKRFAIISLQGKKQISFIKESFIQNKQPGNFKIDLNETQFNFNEEQNVIIAVIENPFTLDETQLLTEDVKFTNLITIKP